ncbi:MAG: phospho-sugar mutase, partial [Verrucomicrobiota bacterium]|nr:phospho-sugar mutase [Verrucomicrobiota bacterium]
KANCGAVITASHNPWHDNGFKVYFEDGAQVVAPHANSIVLHVNEVALNEVTPYLEINLESVVTLSAAADSSYLSVLDEIVLDHELIVAQKPRIVFSPIHGTGAISTVPALIKLGIDVIEVPEQMVQDSSFTSVQSPNPENAEALEMAIAKAEDSDADLVVATDPDADRMGVAVRNSDGEMVLLSGNQIGTLLAEYRITTLKELGVLPEEGTQQAALIMTFVTTPMQEALAKWHGLKTVKTLTGFKWLGEKLADYEVLMKQRLLQKEGIAVDYDACDLWIRADLLMEYSTFFVVGGEESYGYLASDKVRDKDANAAVIMICELAAYLKSQGMTFTDYLDSLYLLYGYYEEQSINIYYEGAAGSHKISNILGSYRARAPEKFGDVLVTGFTDFGKDEIIDVDGKKIPPQDFYFLELSNGYSFAVRASGTEPKIKFYVFGRSDVANLDALPEIKASVAKEMADLLELIESDARMRADAELAG